MKRWKALALAGLATAFLACSGPMAPVPEPKEPDKPGGPDDPRTGMVVQQGPVPLPV